MKPVNQVIEMENEKPKETTNVVKMDNNAGWGSWGDLSRPLEEYLEYFKPGLWTEYRVGFSACRTEIRKDEQGNLAPYPVLILTLDYLNGGPTMRPLIFPTLSKQFASEIQLLERKGYLFNSIFRLKPLERVFSLENGQEIRIVSYKIDIHSMKPSRIGEENGAHCMPRSNNFQPRLR